MIPSVIVKWLRKSQVSLLCCLGLLCGGAIRADAAWVQVWADEFTQANGTSPDTSKWAFDIGTGDGGWGNNEWQYYTARTNNVRIETNMLVIEAKAESYLGSSYTSARLKTLGKASWTYGRMEARMKLPRGQGIWPAFWMLGVNIGSAGWPGCGEIDIMENVGREPTIVHGTIHGPGYSGGNGIGDGYSLPGNPVFADDFHIYAIEWTTNQIKWFVDGTQFFSVSPANLPGGATWVFTQPQFLLLNLAVGGNWPGYPDGTTVFPQRLTVDYVRVYAFSNAPPTTSGVLQNGTFESGVLGPWIGKGGNNANPAGGVITDTNGLVWNPVINAANTSNIKNPAFGKYACKVYGDYNGGPNALGFYQDVVALPGSLWTAAIQARTQNTDHIRDRNQALLEVSFLDASNVSLAKYASPVFTTNTPINTWLTLAATNRVFPTAGTTNLMRAPPGTVKLRFEVTFSQTLYDWGSIYFDEAQLVEVIPPALVAPTLTATLNAVGQIQIHFATQAGATYEVRYKTAVSDPLWQPLETIPGDGGPKTFTAPATAPGRFYSVRVY